MQRKFASASLRGMAVAVYLNQIETSVPPHECHAQFVRALPRALPGAELQEKIGKILSRLGIERRYTVLGRPLDFDGSDPEAFYRFGQFPGLDRRMEVYRQHALPLASLAVEPLLAGTDPQSITHLIVASCTGFYAPGVDLEIAKKFRLAANVERSLIGFMGCYAALPALKLAKHIVRSEPAAKVLVVNLEMCTLHWREDVPFDQWISFMLFGDGCSAALVSAQPKGLRLENFHSGVLAQSEELMRWTMGSGGFFMKLDAKIPDFLRVGLREDLPRLLQQPAEQMKSWAVHPGGRSILDAVQDELHLPDSALRHSREVLRDYGNMSSPTVMFVLQKIMRDPASAGWGCGMAFGPGLSLESFSYHLDGPA